MASDSRRPLLISVILLLLLLVALLLVRCARTAPPAGKPVASGAAPTPAAAERPAPAGAAQAEVLSAATITAPAEVTAGAVFKAEWTGPDNRGDYITIVTPETAASAYGNYTETSKGRALELTAPIQAGDYELRYVTAGSKTILGRAALRVVSAAATLDAPESAMLGNTVEVAWTGPNNPGDYVTVVPSGAPDAHYGNYVETAKGSPVKLTLPTIAGTAELRYVTGQGRKVLGRRALTILTPDTSLEAPAQVTAGKPFEVAWKGPNNPSDYVTIVAKDTPDGRYDNYTETAKGSPLPLTALMTPGEAELRYMTGSGAHVLARRPITIVAATVTLEAPGETVAGARVPITWTGPGNRGDYITIVPKTAPDGQYARYTDTNKGSPLEVEAPIEPGPAEIRYMSGQGAKVLARRDLSITTPKVTLNAPPAGAAGSNVSVEWTGPNNPGDYLTIVPKSAKDGVSLHTAPAARNSPSTLRLPKEVGPAEVRYMSGQGNRVLGRADIESTQGTP